MARPNPMESARTFITRGGMPITLVTLTLALVGFTAFWSSKFSGTLASLYFDTDGWWARPWTLFTYAFLEYRFGALLCSGLLLFFFMGSLERAWGRRRFLPAYAILLVAPPLAIWIGAMVSGVSLGAGGIWLPSLCWTVAFGAYRPQSQIFVFGLIAVLAKWIAVVAAMIIVFDVGSGAPLAGLCAGLAPLAAWALGANRLTLKMPGKRGASFRDEFGKSLQTKRDAESERLKLRELLERSVREDEAE
jgi:membrane associated rhomboid family serine protease